MNHKSFIGGKERRQFWSPDSNACFVEKYYSQSGGMEAIASSEPQERFFFAGVMPGRA
jgi:hypothetical protein